MITSTESRRKIDNCSFHLFVATLENLGPLNRTFTVLKTVSSVFHIFIARASCEPSEKDREGMCMHDQHKLMK